MILYNCSAIYKCKHDLVHLLPRVEAMIQRMRAASATISMHQKQRQKDIWYLTSVAVSTYQSCMYCMFYIQYIKLSLF